MQPFLPENIATRCFSRFLKVPHASDLHFSIVRSVRFQIPTTTVLPFRFPTGGSDEPEASLFPLGAGKKYGGAQQPVRREDTGIPGSDQTLTLWPHPRTLSPHASLQVLHALSGTTLGKFSFCHVQHCGSGLLQPWEPLARSAVHRWEDVT